MSPSDLNPFLETLAAEEGFVLSGWTALSRPLHFEFYRNWIQEGLHGKMSYLENHLPIKEAPQSRFPLAQSVFIFAMPYRPHPKPQNFPLQDNRIASYAQGADYHFWLKEKLQRIQSRLSERYPEQEFECHTDSSPLLERDLAWQAGLGWIGKNTCLIDRKEGSFFLLGEILTSLAAPTSNFEPVPDFCGTCTRCIDICPTKALVEPRKIDARKCISYLSIESREVPAQELRDGWGDWFFGCDLCQSICPWNAKPFRPSTHEKQSLLPKEAVDEVALCSELQWILKSSGKSLERAFQGTALSRAGGFGLKRNALMVIGNRRLNSLRSEVLELRDHERLGELAQWCLGKLDSELL